MTVDLALNTRKSDTKNAEKVSVCVERINQLVTSQELKFQSNLNLPGLWMVSDLSKINILILLTQKITSSSILVFQTDPGGGGWNTFSLKNIQIFLLYEVEVISSRLCILARFFKTPLSSELWIRYYYFCSSTKMVLNIPWSLICP